MAADPVLDPVVRAMPYAEALLRQPTVRESYCSKLAQALAQRVPQLRTMTDADARELMRIKCESYTGLSVEDVMLSSLAASIAVAIGADMRVLARVDGTSDLAALVAPVLDYATSYAADVIVPRTPWPGRVSGN